VKLKIESPETPRSLIQSTKSLNSIKSINTSLPSEISLKSLSSYSSGTRAAIFTIAIDNLPKNPDKTRLRIGYQCDPFINFYLTDVLIHNGRDYYKKHSKHGLWRFKVREPFLTGHKYATIVVLDRSDKYGDKELGKYDFKLEDLVIKQQLKHLLPNGKTKFSIKIEFS